MRTATVLARHRSRLLVLLLASTSVVCISTSPAAAEPPTTTTSPPSYVILSSCIVQDGSTTSTLPPPCVEPVRSDQVQSMHDDSMLAAGALAFALSVMIGMSFWDRST